MRMDYTKIYTMRTTLYVVVAALVVAAWAGMFWRKDCEEAGRVSALPVVPHACVTKD